MDASIRCTVDKMDASIGFNIGKMDASFGVYCIDNMDVRIGVYWGEDGLQYWVLFEQDGCQYWV